jgi:hypothetical protein
MPGSDGLLRQRALLGLVGESSGAHTAGRRLELPLSEALLLGRMSGDLPRLTGPDLRSPQEPRMADRAMATAQGPTRTL